MNELFALLTNLIMHAPKISADAMVTYAGVAHGEGGAAKISAALHNVATLIEDAAGITPEAVTPQS